MNPGLLVGAGFLLGSVGVKALTSKKAKQLYVKGIVQGMRAKEEVETMVDEARAEFDDLLAEAGYVKESEDKKDASALVEAPKTEEVGEEETFNISRDIMSGTPKKADATPAPASDDVVKQVAKLVTKATKTADKNQSKGGHGHGHGRK